MTSWITAVDIEFFCDPHEQYVSDRFADTTGVVNADRCACILSSKLKQVIDKLVTYVVTY